MSIEMLCAGCGQTLRVGDENAGKKGRCPGCGTIVQVPLEGGSESTPTPTQPLGPVTESMGESNPFADRPAAAPINPYAGPSVRPGSTGRYLKPHRGGMILTFGILGIVCCMPFGIVAWAMGASDLGEIRRGQMDPSGQALTQVGMILGIVSVAFAVIGIGFSILASAFG